MKLVSRLSEKNLIRFASSSSILKPHSPKMHMNIFAFLFILISFNANAIDYTPKPLYVEMVSETGNGKSDSLQKEFLITRTTTKKELAAIQRLLSEHNYLIYIETEVFNNNELLQISGYIKFNPSAGKGWHFDISDFESIRITLNLDNKRGEFQLDTIRSKEKKVD